jgi:regulator of sigma E protease
MHIVIMVAQLLLSLSILVFIHELGHFLAAKAFKTRVDKFYLFFDFLFPLPDKLNFALFKKKVGETEYGIGWFPLGGYVSIAGMVDETQDADSLASEPQPWEYRSKRSWQKMIIILGGIIFNIIFAILIYATMTLVVDKYYVPTETLKSGDITFTQSSIKYGFKDSDIIKLVNGECPKRIDDLTPMSIILNGGNYQVERVENGQKSIVKIDLPSNLMDSLKEPLFYASYSNLLVKKISSGSNAEKAGLEKNDIIKIVNGTEILNFDMFKSILDSSKEKQIEIQVSRENKIHNLKVLVDKKGTIGFFPSIIYNKDKYQTRNYSILESIKYGTIKSFNIFGLMFENIKKIFQGKVKAADSVGGPVAMAKGFGSVWDWTHFWEFTAMISVCLAFMNLLPIPGLDGGHAVIISIESIIRRPVSPRILQILQNIGTYMILGLMIFAFYNDITRK